MSQTIVIEAFEKPLGSRYRIAQVLIGSTHLSGIQGGCVQQWKVYCKRLRGPAINAIDPSVFVMPEKTFGAAVAVIVECDHAIGHKYMAATKARRGFNLNSVPLQAGKSVKKYAGQNVATAKSKENPIGKRPTANRVLLDTGLQTVHVLRSTLVS